MYKIYKAVVVDIVYDEDRDGVFDIYVQDKQEHGPAKKKALPPSSMATSKLGSGMLSLPDIGQECLVAEDELLDPAVQIITYTTEQYSSPFGSLSGEKFSAGGLVFKVGGIHRAVLSLERDGVIGLFSNAWASMSLHGARGAYNLISKTYERRSKIGADIETLDTSNNRTSHV